MHVATAGTAADVQLLEQGVEFCHVGLGDTDEEQDAAPVARAALREEEQPLVTGFTPKVGVQYGLSVHDPSTYGADAHELGDGRTGAPHADAGVSQLSEMAFELATQEQSFGRFGHRSPLGRICDGLDHDGDFRHGLPAQMLGTDPPFAAIG